MNAELTHVDAAGNAHMVDVSSKAPTHRTAVASAAVVMDPSTLALIVENRAAKGDVLAVARLDGVLAPKRTADLIPLCHPLSLDRVTVDLWPDGDDRIAVEATAGLTGRTGVEMEALTAAAVAALTVYDMCKAVDRGMVVTDVRLERKEGGRSGEYVRAVEEAALRTCVWRFSTSAGCGR